MKEVKTSAGTLRLTRNISLIATASCIALGSLIANENIVLHAEPIVHSICGIAIDLCAIFPGTIAYHNHQQLKKVK